MGIVTAGILMGLGGTIAMDAWAWTLERAAGVARPNWGHVGRWVGHLPRWRHAAIAEASPVGGELALGWAFHYFVGVLYGVVFVWIAGPDWLAAPTLLPALVFAVLTIAAGWFVLQPGLGLGWAASRTPSPWTVRGLGLAAHVVFGLGMWAVAAVS